MERHANRHICTLNYDSDMIYISFLPSLVERGPLLHNHVWKKGRDMERERVRKRCNSTSKYTKHSGLAVPLAVLLEVYINVCDLVEV